MLIDKYIMITDGRSGSHFFADLIKRNLGISFYEIDHKKSYEENLRKFKTFPDSEKLALKVGFTALKFIIPKHVYITPNKHIFLKRRDIIAQAISRLFARNIHHTSKNRKSILEIICSQGDMLEIADNHVKEEIRRNNFIEGLIEENGLNPYRIFYEDFISSEGQVNLLRELSNFLEIPCSVAFCKSHIQRQKQEEKKYLIDKYKESHLWKSHKIR